MILIDLKCRLPMGGQRHILKTLSRRPIFLEVFHIFIKNQTWEIQVKIVYGMILGISMK